MLCSLAQRLNYAVVKAEESEMLSLRLGELLKSVMSSGSWYKSGFKRLLRGEKKKTIITLSALFLPGHLKPNYRQENRLESCEKYWLHCCLNVGMESCQIRKLLHMFTYKQPQI